MTGSPPPSQLRRIVLLGDSILDNAPYTAPAPDTTAHLQRVLGAGWEVQRLAQDGATMPDIAGQLEGLRGDADWMVLSIGGNDALRHAALLEHGSAAGAGGATVLDELAAIADDFTAEYARVLELVIPAATRLVACTIYNAPLEPAALARRAHVALGVLNDRIVRAATARGVPVLDLRTICAQPDDFVLQIEPSARGAQKIAGALGAIVLGDRVIRGAPVVGLSREG